MKEEADQERSTYDSRSRDQQDRGRLRRSTGDWYKAGRSGI